MQAYARLLDQLSYIQGRNRKLEALRAYFQAAPDPDRGWALASLTDGIAIRLPLRRIVQDLTSRLVDPVLYALSRDYVGDTAETVALLWPEPMSTTPPPTLDQVVTGIATASTPERTRMIGGWLDSLDASGRWALLKFLGGAPRVGVSARLARTALAEAFGRDVGEVEELWHGLAPPYLALFAWLEGRGEKPDIGDQPVFRPVMLAHPIADVDWPRLAPADFAAEWKWDGIRVQIAAKRGLVRIFSRQGDDISASFPEIQKAFEAQSCVVDGELLVAREEVIAPFNDLQQRLNRKIVSAKLLRDHPAHVRLYDLLFDGDEDLRSLSFTERRARLETWHARQRPLLTDLSPLVPFDTFDELGALWSSAREAGIEGLMLKRKAGDYQAGRVKGEWFKWKRAALTLDCVLMYAQRGSGKRSSFYSDYTFGVWREPDGAERAEAAGGSAEGGARERELVPVGKAYSGFTDEELRRLDQWIRTHTVESFGPVRAVERQLVLEVAFDAVQRSARHKSGVAMRFPRIHRIRWDKPAAEADTLAAIQALIVAPRADPGRDMAPRRGDPDAPELDL